MIQQNLLNGKETRPNTLICSPCIPHVIQNSWQSLCDLSHSGNYQISHIPGKYLYTADALSQSSVHHIPDTTDLIQQEEVEHFIQTVPTHLPASKEHLEVYCQAQLTDPTCTAVRNYCIIGWPSKQQLTDNLLPYWKVRGELSLNDNLLLYGSQIAVPTNLQNETLHKIHQGHQGIQRCRLRIASSSVWWPGVSKAIESYVKNCPQCLNHTLLPKNCY